MSDQVWDEESKSYKPLNSSTPAHMEFFTDWFVAGSTQPAATYQISPKNNGFSSADMILIAGAGIQYGKPAPDGSIQPVPHAGAAKILKCI